MSNNSKSPNQDLVKGNFQPGVNLTPGKEPFPLAGQRAVRGVLVLVLISLTVAAISQSFFLVNMISNRTARIVPAAEQIGVSDGMALSSSMLTAFAMRYSMNMETWDKKTLKIKLDEVRYRTDPSLIPDFEKMFSGLIPTATSNQMARVGVVRDASVIGNNNGEYAIGVFMDIISTIGEGQKKEISNEEVKIIYITIVRDLVTERNPEGFRVLKYIPLRGQDWLDKRLPRFWERLEDKKP